MTAAEFERFLSTLPRERTWLLPALAAAQQAEGFVSDGAVRRIAAHLRLTANDIEGVATGYPELRRHPPGRRVVRVCTGVTCLCAGADRVLTALEQELGIRPGQTTEDGVTLEETSCCFLCGVAPVIDVDGACRGRVTPGQAIGLVLADPVAGPDDPAER